MPGYADTKKLIEDTLVNRPAGTVIVPEDHQAFALSMLDYIHAVELLGASTLQGGATVDTVPVQPTGSRVSYISSVPPGQTYVYTNFLDENGDPITVTSGVNTVCFLTLLWNGSYWTVSSTPVTVVTGDADVVRYTPQTLDDAQKAQARTNIGFEESTIELLYSIFGEDYIRTEMAKRQYLTFEAVGDATTVKFYAYDDGSGDLHAKTIEVSTDGTTWTEKTSTAEGTTLATLNAGQKLYVRGNNEAYGWLSGEDYVDDLVSNFFAADKDVYVYGNVMSLVIGDDALSGRQVALAPYAFAYLFSGYSDTISGEFILSHPTKSLVLPATTLAARCYQQMFSGCTGLTSAPALPATTLAEYCYGSMFSGCTGLTSAPALPATTLAANCYNSMFYGCTGLTSAPALPATTLAARCYNTMFQGCTGLTSAPVLPATTLAERCYNTMFYNCTGLTTAPELPATTLTERCYHQMFSGCTGLTSAPVLPATTLAARCYDSMFYNCTGLTSAPVLPATTLAARCYNSMFYNCTGLTTAPELPATTLTERCYGYMFSGCSNLASVTCLATTTATNATSDWLKNVAASGTFTKSADAAQNFWASGVSGIPSGWTVETANAFPQETEYLTFEAVGDATTVKFYAYSDGSDDLHEKTIEVSTDGATWTEKTSTAEGTTLATLNAGQKLYVRGNNEAYGWYSGEDYMDSIVGNFFAADKDVYVYGNVMSLVIGDDALSGRQVALAPRAFACLFFSDYEGISGEFILSHPTKSLVLPATTLADYCYYNMFYNCGLTTAPTLPATTLAEECYSGMFCDCSNLAAVTCLATTTASFATYQWLEGVAASGTFKKSADAAQNFWASGASGIPSGWTVETA